MSPSRVTTLRKTIQELRTRYQQGDTARASDELQQTIAETLVGILESLQAIQKALSAQQEFERRRARQPQDEAQRWEV